jgi:hypothetical protein
MIEVLQFYQTNIAPVVRFFPIVAILILWIGLVRAGFSPRARTTGLVVTGMLLVWWVASDLLARSGFFTEHWGVMRPVCWMIAILLVIPLMRSATIGGALDALPLWLLPLLQVYRAGGDMAWFGLMAAGKIPASYGLVVGTGDASVGICGRDRSVPLFRRARRACHGNCVEHARTPGFRHRQHGPNIRTRQPCLSCGDDPRVFRATLGRPPCAVVAAAYPRNQTGARSADARQCKDCVKKVRIGSAAHAITRA